MSHLPSTMSIFMSPKKHSLGTSHCQKNVLTIYNVIFYSNSFEDYLWVCAHCSHRRSGTKYEMCSEQACNNRNYMTRWVFSICPQLAQRAGVVIKFRVPQLTSFCERDYFSCASVEVVKLLVVFRRRFFQILAHEIVNVAFIAHF